MNLATSGACSESAVKCSANDPCEGKAKCNLDQGMVQRCNLVNPTGTCWQLPESCPKTGAGERTRRCLGIVPSDCATYCEAVEQEVAFYKANNCANNGQ